MTTRCSPAASRSSQRGLRLGGFCAEHSSERGHPFADGSGIVVDDVVEARRAFFDRDRRALRRVVNAQERPPAAAVSDPRTEIAEIQKPPGNSAEIGVSRYFAR
jgi:hypothetical protein